MHEVTDIKTSLQQILENIELTTNQEQIPDKRRSSWRYKWQCSATVRFMGSDGAPESLYVSVVHISPIGLDFRCSRKIERGQQVMIILELEDANLEIPATVKHTTASVGRNIIGVDFDLD